ncbi:hypothetical protein ANME2D_01801 [Candidatus Methanoperedens nitroreducens]|uniref:Uncharacterized protein n=1 Tax=Candidatus Methanoperedens nitratireducens TaxID=1392998 RepID=A0A062V2Z9_9EURY|nr:hypothetical protein [Candidatus Methanoperedens nitroreducens]KCZ71747.1 hypothetical protein ANME2D_01801 [Candidatus Methanoperedens nitroreducens]MDJ1422280.1 hypothetical protein [Candidatus Methanoperedens sp.]
MQCKNSRIDCVTRIINRKWEEARACDYGVPCDHKDKKIKA